MSPFCPTLKEKSLKLLKYGVSLRGAILWYFSDAGAVQLSDKKRRTRYLRPANCTAKIVALTPDAQAREDLKLRLRTALADGLLPEAYVRETQLVFGPYTPFPVEFRVMGPDPAELYAISEKVLDVKRGISDVRQPSPDWGSRAPVVSSSRWRRSFPTRDAAWARRRVGSVIAMSLSMPTRLRCMS